MPQSPFDEPDNESNLNSAWMKFKRWYEFQKDGWSINIQRTKEGLFDFFIRFRKRF